MKTTRRRAFEAGRGYSREDWDAVSDNPEWSAADIAAAKPFAEALPAIAESIRRSRGRPRVDAPKQAVTLRVEPATLEKFRATGKNWRARMAKVLDKAEV